jgi:mitogen-activated protein kinase 15
VEDHILKRFDLLEFKGKGAYGIVWKAIDKKTQQTVALKKVFIRC